MSLVMFLLGMAVTNKEHSNDVAFCFLGAVIIVICLIVETWLWTDRSWK